MSNRNYKKQNPVRIGRVNLGNPAEVKRVTRLSVDLQLQTEALTKKDMRAWRNAWQYAKNVEYPNRVSLYDVYGDVEVDMHLTGCVGQRKGYVLNKSFRIVDRKGVENPELTAIFEAPWFKTFMDLALDAHYWGALAHPVGRCHLRGRDTRLQRGAAGTAPPRHPRIRGHRGTPAGGMAERL